MWIELDRQIGRMAIEQGKISNESFIQVMRSRSEEEPQVSLLLLLLQKKYLSLPETMDYLTKALTEIKQPSPFKKILLEALMVTDLGAQQKVINPQQKNLLLIKVLEKNGKATIWDVLFEAYPSQKDFLAGFKIKLEREYLVCPNCYHFQKMSQWDGTTTLTCIKCALPLALPNPIYQTPVPWGDEKNSEDLRETQADFSNFEPSPSEETTDIVDILDTSEGDATSIDLRLPLEETAISFSPAVPPKNSSSASRYIVLRRIGEGGMGIVLEAMDTYLRRRVAIKVLRQDIVGDSKNVTRFIHEAKATAKLGHPNIVQVHDLGYQPDGNVYFTMRLIKGVPLSEVLELLIENDGETLEKYSLTRLLHIFVSICQAISYAHSKGVLHRDIKPENVMVGEFGEVQVMDWGLAKIKGIYDIPFDTLAGSIEEEPLTMAGTIIGTPAYMSPEQASAANEIIDERSDLYSLGVILYEILTDDLPFPSDHIPRLLKNIATREPLPPRWKAPEKKIPRALDSICQKALRLKQEDRYQTVLALAEDVQNYLEGQPVSVLKERWSERALRFFAHHQIFSLSLILAFSLLVSIFLSVYFYYKIGKKSREKIQLQQKITSLLTAKNREEKACYFYQRAMELKGKNGLPLLRIRLLDKAIQADPSYLLSYVEKARAYEEMALQKKIAFEVENFLLAKKVLKSQILKGENLFLESLEMAYRAYNAGLHQAPNHPFLLYSAGRFLFDHPLLGKSSLLLFQRALNQGPENFYSLLSQSRILWSQKKYPEALEGLQKAFNLAQEGEKGEIYWLEGKIHMDWSGLEDLEKMRKAQGAYALFDSCRLSSSADFYFQRGRLSIALGERLKAYDYFQRALELLPVGHYRRIYYRSWAFWARKNTKRVLIQLWKLPRFSSSMMARFSQEVSLLFCRTLFQKSLDHPEDSRAFEQATSTLKALLNQKVHQFQTELIFVERLIRMNRFQMAQKKLSQLKQTHPQAYKITLLQVLLYLYQKRFQEAERLLVKLKKRLPSSAEIYLRFAYLYSQQEKYNLALRANEKAGDLGDPDGYEKAGYRLLQQKKRKRALRDFQKAAQLRNTTALGQVIRKIQRRSKK